MEGGEAVAALQALAQGSRLEVFRLLVRRGTEGLAAGEIARRLGLQKATLSFHLAQLGHAGLVSSRRAGRSILYTAAFERMRGVLDFLL